MKIGKVRICVVAAFTVAALGFAAGAAAAESDVVGNAVDLGPPVFGTYSGPSAPPSDPNVWGTGNWTVLNLPAIGFHGQRDAQYWTHAANWIFHYAGVQFFDCGFQLPTGSVLYGLTPNYYDNSTTEEFRIWLWKDNIPGTDAGTQTELYSFFSGDPETPGYSGSFRSLAANEEIVNWDQPGDASQYFHIRIALSSVNGDSDVRFAGVTLWYQLQISPAPAVATFPDVGTGFWAFQEIEALAASGITQGFPDGTFRPTNPVTRAQMATFLARALGLHFGDLDL